MSTYYYDLAEPYSAIRVEPPAPGRPHAVISLYEDGRPCGRIAVSEEGYSDAIYALRGPEIGRRNAAPYGATRYTATRAPRCRQVISEYGDVVDARDLKDTPVPTCPRCGEDDPHAWGRVAECAEECGMANSATVLARRSASAGV